MSYTSTTTCLAVCLISHQIRLHPHYLEVSLFICKDASTVPKEGKGEGENAFTEEEDGVE